jgi:serine/threonine protein kinase
VLISGGVCKIADFGFSREALSKAQLASHDSLRWTSPEAIAKKEYTFASDVWSFGVVLFEIFTEGKFPYSHLPWETRKIVAEVTGGFRLPRPQTCPLAIFELMLLTWHQDPKRRPTFAAILDRLKSIDTNSTLLTRMASTEHGSKLIPLEQVSAPTLVVALCSLPLSHTLPFSRYIPGAHREVPPRAPS